jgi:hypothetical protein
VFVAEKTPRQKQDAAHRSGQEALCFRLPSNSGLPATLGLATLLCTAPFERSRLHGRRYACLLVEAFSWTRLRSRCRRGNLFGRCSTFGCSQ